MAQASKPQTLSGLGVFAAQGCANCHTLSAAKATGASGPDLDYLGTYAQRAGKPLDAFIRESILDPAAYIEPGCVDGMPHNFKDLIQPDQLGALVAYLVKNGSKTTPHKGCGG
jgi:mono/diheme cytochrome c family protein